MLLPSLYMYAGGILYVIKNRNNYGVTLESTYYRPLILAARLLRSFAESVLPCAIFLGISLGANVQAATPGQPLDDPIEQCKKIIDAHPEHWTSGASTAILERFALGSELQKEEQIYRLLESPGLTLDFLQDDEGGSEKYLSKNLLLKLLRNAVNAPQATSRNVARATLSEGLQEYTRAYSIAGKYQASREVSMEDAIAFLDNRYGYAKLEDAQQLLNTQMDISSAADENKKVRDKLRAIEKRYPDNISAENTLKEIYEFYRLLEEENIGIAAFEPYRQFKQVMEELNKSRIAQRRKYRSIIKITQPQSSTVWQLNEAVSLEWTTSNIPAEKSIRFFLVKGETVVQELGTFKNIGAATGIRLNKNIDSGSDYKVVGIELFPANKNFVAKIATSNFTIRRPERKKPAAVVKETPKEIKTEPLEQRANMAVTEPDSLRYERMSFEGRKISYVQELTVDATDIRISIWDHGRQDRDIVSIYLNGEAVVSKHYLTYHKKHFDVRLDANKKNDLFLYAHNLGFYPPNTVSIEVIDNSTSENIVLNSDLQSCEAVLINVRP